MGTHPGTRRRPAVAGRLGVLLFFFLAAVLTFTTHPAKASASTVPTVENRVGVLAPKLITAVGAPEHITAGRHPDRGPPQLRRAEGVCVAAKTGIAGATRLSAAEQATASRLMRLPSSKGRTFSESPHVGAEYVDDLGRTYDALGTPLASQYWNESQFLRSIDSHLLKSNDFTVIDLTGFTSGQVGAVSRHVGSLAPELQARIIRIGF